MKEKAQIEESQVVGVLIDAAAIQSYVFGSNRLRENIGASYIIAHLIYGQILHQALKSTCTHGRWSMDWKHQRGLQMESQHHIIAEIGYIGGGNALVFFRNGEDELARTFIQTYTLLILLHFPGLRLVFGTASTTFKELKQDYQKFRTTLEASLTCNKNTAASLTKIPKPGIVEDCPQSNEAADQYLKDGDAHVWVSKGTQQKWRAASESQSRVKQDYPSFLNTRFGFTLELEKLGQLEEKGYIAIVHIDGNGIGKRFQACASLNALRDLSQKVSSATNAAMQDLVNELCQLLISNGALSDEFNLAEENGTRLLPLRPILVGGDDVVFVCEGRLGLYLAERYVHFFTAQMKTHLGAGQQASACAGVAIVKTKYPFYRAYTLAEELMREAKKAARHDANSWLDFMVVSAGFNGGLEEIRNHQYKVGNTKLNGGPYHLSTGAPGISILKNGIAHFQNHWPRNKVMQLRDMLTQPPDVQAYFMEGLHSRDTQLKLPSLNRPPRKDDKAEFLNPIDFGHYMDMIELFSFYPTILNT